LKKTSPRISSQTDAGKFGHATVIFIVRFIYMFSFQLHTRLFFLLLEKTECKSYEHKWSTRNKLNQNRFNLEDTGSRFPRKADSFYQNTWHCITEDLFSSHHCENLKFHTTNLPRKEKKFLNIIYKLRRFWSVIISMEFRNKIFTVESR
jgi:hypothetical protein